MFSVTVNIAAPGTPMANGERSKPGHMWIELTDNNGTRSYGFAPQKTSLIGAGEVTRSDQSDYLGARSYTRTMTVSADQFAAMEAFAKQPGAQGFSTTYNAFTNSCVDFAWAVLQRGGLNPSGFQGNLMPTSNKDEVRKIVDWNPSALGSFDRYMGVLNGDGTTTHSFFSGSGQLFTGTFLSDLDIWNFQGLGQIGARYETYASLYIPAELEDSYGNYFSVDQSLVAQAAADLSNDLLAQYGRAAIGEQLGFQAEPLPRGDWRVSFSYVAGERVTPLVARLQSLGKPKGVDAFMQWFQARAESILKDALVHASAPLPTGEFGEGNLFDDAADEPAAVGLRRPGGIETASPDRQLSQGWQVHPYTEQRKHEAAFSLPAVAPLAVFDGSIAWFSARLADQDGPIGVVDADAAAVERYSSVLIDALSQFSAQRGAIDLNVALTSRTGMQPDLFVPH
jgi:hypothetical protein